MPQPITIRKVFLQPGFVCLPAEESVLCAVASSGVICTMYDERRKRGGMGVYAFPFRQKNKPSTAFFAGPALFSLFHLLLKDGSCRDDLEAYLYGGAENPLAAGFSPTFAETNIRAGKDLLRKFGVKLAGSDLGGRWGRKIAFNSSTGETLLAKTDKIRETDWYPLLP